MICAVVLAAGEGRRLRPLTEVRPKALCPVGNVPLLDRALALVAAAGVRDVAVNACWLADQVVDAVAGRARLSVEPAPPWGTAGGLARLRDWIDGRAVLVGNADSYLAGPGIAALCAGWDGRTVRVLGVPGPPDEFGGHRFAGFSLLPWEWVRDLPVQRGELVGAVWRPAERAGRLEVVPYPGTFLDTGTPARYLAANLHAAGEGSLVADDARVTGELDRAVVGAGAVVAGRVTRGVVWPGAVVGPDEHLVDAVRVGTRLTVPAYDVRVRTAPTEEPAGDHRDRSD